MRQPKCIYLCMVLSSVLTLTSFSHAHDGERLHVSLVSGLPSAVEGFTDMFDDILGSTHFHHKSVAIMPEQQSFYKSCSYRAHQWALFLACRYYGFKERFGAVRYWIVERMVTHYYSGVTSHETGITTCA